MKGKGYLAIFLAAAATGGVLLTRRPHLKVYSESSSEKRRIEYCQNKENIGVLVVGSTHDIMAHFKGVARVRPEITMNKETGRVEVSQSGVPAKELYQHARVMIALQDLTPEQIAEYKRLHLLDEENIVMGFCYGGAAPKTKKPSQGKSGTMAMLSQEP